MHSISNQAEEQSKVLIVDDEQEILKSLTRRFEFEGIPVRICQNPVEALNLMMQNHYNIVITDIRMPGMDGIELLQALKSVNPLCNVIMITGYSSMTYVVEYLSNGVCDYFAKPLIDVDILVDAVKGAIDRIKRWKKGMGIEVRSIQ